MDDFGEMAMGVGAMDHDFTDFAIGQNSSNFEEARRDGTGLGFEKEMTPFLDGAQPSRNLFGEDDFGGEVGAMDDDFGDMGALAPLDGAGEHDDLMLGAAANNLQGEENSFALEPLEAGALERLPKRNQRKRRLIIDEQKNIGGDEMKNNMADYK